MFDESGSLFGEAVGGSGLGEWVTAYCDGGSRGNPGPAGYGVYIEGPEGQTIAELSEFLGKTTNNVAEYSGLLAAIDFALKNGYRRLRVVADSELMVKQMQGRYKVNSPDLRPLYEEAKRGVAGLERFRIEHVLRGKNRKADRLANLAMDRGRPGRDGAAAMEKTQQGTGAVDKLRSGSGVRFDSGAAAPSGGSHRRPVKEPQRVLKGYVKDGVVHLLDGELPDGIFVRVTPDRQ